MRELETHSSTSCVDAVEVIIGVIVIAKQEPNLAYYLAAK
jgi:hypothetical protein